MAQKVVYFNHSGERMIAVFEPSSKYRGKSRQQKAGCPA